MTEAENAQLKTGAQALGITLTDGQVQRLWRYVELLLVWNQKISLTTVTELQAIIDKHLLDCLAVLPLLPKEPGTRIIDAGTGAGLPSVVLSIARPDLRITAVESVHKKVTFVRAVVRELDLEVVVEPVRLELLAIPALFDVAVSRATFDPSEWVERATSLVRVGGVIISMLSEHQEVPAAPAGFEQRPVVGNHFGGAYRAIACYERVA